MKIEEDYFDMTLAGILHPNNESKAGIIRYSAISNFSSPQGNILLDSLIKHLVSICSDLNYDGRIDYLVCKYGNDNGRLTIYFR